MKTWAEYKHYVKGINELNNKQMEEIEALAEIIAPIISRRKELGLSQRQLASLCDLPQSTLGRIETFQTVPNLDTVLKILRPLHMKLTISIENDTASLQDS